MCGYLISHQREDRHDDVLSDRHHVGPRHFSDGNVVLVGFVQIDVITSNSGRHAKLELGRLVDQLRSEVSWVERCGDDDFRLLSV